MKSLLRHITMVRIGTFVGLVGAAYVSSGDSLMANIIWAMSNPVLVVYNFKKKEYEQAFMFTVFFILAVRGVLIL